LCIGQFKTSKPKVQFLLLKWQSPLKNVYPKDPFAAEEAFDEEDVSTTTTAFKSASAKSAQADVIHIRIQQRNGRKTLTTIQGLPKDFDPKKVLKAAKKGASSFMSFVFPFSFLNRFAKQNSHATVLL